jgi:hypothetical protein
VVRRHGREGHRDGCAGHRRDRQLALARSRTAPDATFVVRADAAGPFDSHTGTIAVLNLLLAAVATRLRRMPPTASTGSSRHGRRASSTPFSVRRRPVTSARARTARPASRRATPPRRWCPRSTTSRRKQGLGVLRDGGSAADSRDRRPTRCSRSTMPNLCGMGGDLFALVVARATHPRRRSTRRSRRSRSRRPRACAPRVGTRCRSSSTSAQ